MKQQKLPMLLMQELFIRQYKPVKLFSGKTIEEVDLCGQKVYKTFWDDAKVPGTTVCKYENNKVTYGLDQKEAVRGVYPIPETPTTPEK